MNNWTNYPKVHTVGSELLTKIHFLDKVVNVEEKIDGSQFSFGIDPVPGTTPGTLRTKSKNEEFLPSQAPKPFRAAVQTVVSITNDLTPGYVYRAEVLSKPKHNTAKYERVPKGNLIILDINDADGNYLPYEAKRAEATRLGLECVPLLYTGVMTMPMLQAAISGDSVLGGKVEGVVLKPVNYDVKDHEGCCIFGRFVTEEFKEKNHAYDKGSPGARNIEERVRLFAEQFRTEARWNKALQHLRDDGKLTNEPKDIGLLVAEVHRDIFIEYSVEITNKLLDFLAPVFKKTVVSGLPEWYKQKLAKPDDAA